MATREPLWWRGPCKLCRRAMNWRAADGASSGMCRSCLLYFRRLEREYAVTLLMLSRRGPVEAARLSRAGRQQPADAPTPWRSTPRMVTALWARGCERLEGSR